MFTEDGKFQLVSMIKRIRNQVEVVQPSPSPNNEESERSIDGKSDRVSIENLDFSEVRTNFEEILTEGDIKVLPETLENKSREVLV